MRKAEHALRAEVSVEREWRQKHEREASRNKEAVHRLFARHRLDAVDLIQPTDAITRERLSQPAAILRDRFGLITNVISQIQAVVGKLADASLTGADPDLNTGERCLGRPERERRHYAGSSSDRH